MSEVHHRRPSKLTRELIDSAYHYLEIYNLPKDDGGCDEVIPTQSGLGLYLGLTRETIRAWQAGDFPQSVDTELCEEFSVILSVLMQTQEVKLIGGGLGGRYNSTIAKLLLAKHGHSDKVETDHTSSDGAFGGKDINVSIVKPKKK